MLKTLFAAALATLAATPALADAPRTFTRDGQTYVYTMTALGGRTKIAGEIVASGEPFTLTVRHNRVTGFIGDTWVSFAAPRTSRANTTEIAAR